MHQKTGTYKQVLYGIDKNSFYILKFDDNGVIVKQYFDTEKQLKQYIDDNKKYFI